MYVAKKSPFCVPAQKGQKILLTVKELYQQEEELSTVLFTVRTRLEDVDRQVQGYGSFELVPDWLLSKLAQAYDEQFLSEMKKECLNASQY